MKRDGGRALSMGRIKDYELVKLVVGIMYSKDECYSSAIETLTLLYGEVDTQTDEYSFSSISTFYDNEMKGNVKKRFISFTPLIDPSRLSEIKTATNAIEDSLSSFGMRDINIDPCILTPGAFIMATTKGAGFRIPLSGGIYGDLSLVYTNKAWSDFYWTYSDVKSSQMKNYLSRVRDIYLKERKSKVLF